MSPWSICEDFCLTVPAVTTQELRSRPEQVCCSAKMLRSFQINRPSGINNQDLMMRLPTILRLLIYLKDKKSILACDYNTVA